jgi:hypothetical protein
VRRRRLPAGTGSRREIRSRPAEVLTHGSHPCPRIPGSYEQGFCVRVSQRYTGRATASLLLGLLMPPGAGAVIVRAVAVVPAVLLILFTGLLCLLGLVCGEQRRAYVTAISSRAMSTIEVMLHGPAVVPVKRQQKPRQSDAQLADIAEAAAQQRLREAVALYGTGGQADRRG